MSKKEFRFLILLNTTNDNVIDDASLICHKLTVEDFFKDTIYITIEHYMIALDHKFIHRLNSTIITDDYYCHIDYMSFKEYKKHHSLKKYVENNYNDECIAVIENFNRIESVKCELINLFRKNIPHKYLVKYISVGDDNNE